MMDAGDGMMDLAAAADVPLDEGDRMPQVRLEPNLDAVGKRLGEMGHRLDVFDLNEELVYFDHLGRQKLMTPKAFRTWIARYALLYVRTHDDGTPQVTTMKTEDAGALLVNGGFLRGVRVLEGSNRVRLPVIRPDGSLDRLGWGYDGQTRHYTVPGGLEYETDWCLDRAKDWLAQVLGDFPFSDDRSRAVQVASLLALYVRHLPGGDTLRPGFLWLANKPGSGKSVLAKLGLYAVLGHAAVAKMKRGEELDKELEAFQRSAVPYIFLDNIYGGIESATIDQMLTSEESTGRAMGGHSTFIARNRAQLLVTGNSLELNDDAQRRFLVVDLFEKGEPGARTPQMPLNDPVMRSEGFRGKMLAAMWALVRHWHEQGMPKAGKRLATFEEYTELLGGIVAAAGYGEACEPAEIPDAINPEKAEFVELLREVVEDMAQTELEVEDDAEIPPRGVSEKDYTIQDLCRMARMRRLYIDTVGTEEEGRRLTVKMDGLKGEVAGLARDEGYLTPSQAARFGKKLGKHAGTEPEVDGRKVEFGKRKQHNKRFFTIRLL